MHCKWFEISTAVHKNNKYRIFKLNSLIYNNKNIRNAWPKSPSWPKSPALTVLKKRENRKINGWNIFLIFAPSCFLLVILPGCCCLEYSKAFFHFYDQIIRLFINIDYFYLGYWKPANKTFCFDDRADSLGEFWVRLGPIFLTLETFSGFLIPRNFALLVTIIKSQTPSNKIKSARAYYKNIKIYWKIAIDKKIGKISNKNYLAAENL
jgi:hypothetical protein